MTEDKLLEDPDLRNIYQKMIDYLSDGDMAEARLVDRIVRLRLHYPSTKRYERYTSENARKVIPLLRERGYVNEERYAQNLFDSLKDKRDGLRSIRRKMLSRRISHTIVDRILGFFKENNEEQDLGKITDAARKKFLQLRNKYGGDRIKRHTITQRLYAWLAMRGFSTDEIAKIRQKIE